MKVLKWIVAVIVILALAGIGVGAFVGPKIVEAIQSRNEGGTVVQVEPASFGQLTRIVSAPGTVVAKTEVNISSRVSAKIVELPYEAGDEVEKGDVVVRLDSKDLEAALKGAQARLLAERASLKSAEAQLASEEARLAGTLAEYNNAVAEFERRQELFESGDISQSELDTIRTQMEQAKAAYDAAVVALNGVKANVDAAEARVQVAQAEVDRAKENLEFATIRAPIDGVVTRVLMREGEVALGTISNVGATILTIADLSEMLVRARIAEVDINRVKEGQRAKVHINGYEDEVFEGTLKKIALQSQPGSDGTNTFDAEIVLHLGGRRIFTGLTANVEIEVETLDDVFVVPSQAVLDKRADELPKDVRENSRYINPTRTFVNVVYVMNEEGEAEVRPVVVSASNLVNTAVTGDISENDRVIVGPFRSLKDLSDGQLVRLEEPEEDGEGGVELAADEQATGESESSDAETDEDSTTGGDTDAEDDAVAKSDAQTSASTADTADSTTTADAR